MKKLFAVLLAVCIGGAAMPQNKSQNFSSGKSIVVYFSRADENYSVGVIEKGNTEIVAEIIAAEVGAETFHVERATPYSANYRACTNEAKLEQNARARPPLKATIDLSGYDTVYLGYPNWWGDLPMPMYTFIESQDWSDKTVIPFCTHEGSGLGGTEAKLKKVCKGAIVKKGLAIRGTTAQNDRAATVRAVREWFN